MGKASAPKPEPAREKQVILPPSVTRVSKVTVASQVGTNFLLNS